MSSDTEKLPLLTEDHADSAAGSSRIPTPHERRSASSQLSPPSSSFEPLPGVPLTEDVEAFPRGAANPLPRRAAAFVVHADVIGPSHRCNRGRYGHRISAPLYSFQGNNSDAAAAENRQRYSDPSDYLTAGAAAEQNEESASQGNDVTQDHAHGFDPREKWKWILESSNPIKSQWSTPVAQPQDATALGQLQSSNAAQQQGSVLDTAQASHKQQKQKEADTPPLATSARLPTGPCLKFVGELVLWLRSFIRKQLDDMRANSKLVLLATKAGLAASVLSILCILDEPYTWLTSMGLWALVTSDLVFESNIGLSLSKGVNRTLGTLLAGLLALKLSSMTDKLPHRLAQVVTVICVFLSCAIPMYYRFRPPFKDRWNYAASMIVITFHMLLLTNYRREEHLLLPLTRFAMIILGFLVASAVNLSFAQVYAGDTLHALATKNLTAAATVLERCVDEFVKGSVLAPVHSIWSGKALSDDKIYVLYHEIIMSDNEMDRLLEATNFEPAHGRFFAGYPWRKYEEVLDTLRFMVYDIIALDSCLRAEIQAPLDLRPLFAADMGAVATHCAEALRVLGMGIQEFHWTYPLRSMQAAEEAALRLQHSVSKHLSTLIEHHPPPPATRSFPLRSRPPLPRPFPPLHGPALAWAPCSRYLRAPGRTAAPRCTTEILPGILWSQQIQPRGALLDIETPPITAQCLGSTLGPQKPTMH